MRKNTQKMKTIAILLLSCLALPLAAQKTKSAPAPAVRIDAERIVIARDRWGVPHIFAPTDAEVAYGLAWANAEDAFEILQEALAVAKGKMGELKGKEGAKFDFFVHAIGARQTVDSLFSTLSPDYVEYLQGYAQGINDYAAAHSEAVLLKGLFPVTPKDLTVAYVVSFSALGGSVEEMQKIVEGKYDDNTARWHSKGSNAYAFSSKKTTDRKTYLAINPHFFVEGVFSFYEAHLCSEQGLNITGALFHGGNTVFMGNNDNLGWGQTYNYVDQVDVYALQMHPRKKHHYLLDGKYHKLQRRPVRLRVRLGKKFTLAVRRTTYQSPHGMVIRSKDKKHFYALRSPAFFNVKAGEQYYRMNKATDFESFRQALRMNSLTMFNLVYADKDDNIFYICNSRLPRRHADYDFRQPVAGTESAAIWQSYYPTDSLPQVANPKAGYVFNTNNSPSNATAEGENFPRAKVDPYIDLRSGDNNRSTRFMEILAESPERLDFDAFKAIKFDLRMSPNSKFFKSIAPLLQLSPDDYPHLDEPLRLLAGWDGDCSPTNTTAPIFMLTMERAFKKMGYYDDVFITGAKIPDSVFIQSLEEACGFLLQHHNSIKVPLNGIMCHLRGDKLHPLSGGFPDALSPAFGEHVANGKYKMLFADTYIHFVKFNHRGAETIETLLPFERTSTCEQYDDELEMFNNRQLKTMSLDKVEILRRSVRTYHPRRKNSELSTDHEPHQPSKKRQTRRN